MAVRSKTRVKRTASLRSRRKPRVVVRHDLTEPEPGPPLVPELIPDRRERKRQGRVLREKTPREEHARWQPPADRPDPIALLEASNSGRLPSLVPIRHARMLEDPFAFLRGSAIIMANDLAHTPNTGVKVQACGDAHLANFGMYATPERNVVFDVNDFDETLPAPWEWDLKRLVASIWVAGRCACGATEAGCEEAVAACVRSYRRWMGRMSRWSFLDVWYARVDAESLLETIHQQERGSAERTLAQARRRTQLATLPKLTELREGRRCIIHDPPLIVRTPREHAEELAEVLQVMAGGYLSSLQGDRGTLVRRYQTVDVARKVVGVGSVGTRCYVALLLGAHAEDPLFLQVKEAGPSVLEPFAGKSTYAQAGQRVVEGQRLMQAASDIFLGWCQVGGRDFYVRQLRDMKGSIDVERLSPRGLREYASMCGWALARAHARGGDAALLRGYLGRGDVFDQALCRFARAYADQTERDFAAFQKAVRGGRLQAHEDA
ncbi:DUF2252 domain-containing protein [Archangium violaceum]|uniref:DUF2252 domain-containing protein n=1 Tax=Archangium violaceum TaxID=83451 RepID=UPI00194ED13B|nr:DUF2252 domain-containing protein [Archangium violaceum]QRO02198.1 DUF2252 domain-containing protein [Archangium violaceum]